MESKKNTSKTRIEPYPWSRTQTQPQKGGFFPTYSC